MPYSHSLHNKPPIYPALKKTNTFLLMQCYFSCFPCSLLSTAPWKSASASVNPLLKCCHSHRGKLSISGHSMRWQDMHRSAPLSFGNEEPIWQVCFQSYKKFLLLVLRSVCRAGSRWLRVEAQSCLPCSFTPFGCSKEQLGPVLGGQGTAGPVRGCSRPEEAAPQVPAEAVQWAAAARRIHHGEPGVDVGLRCLPRNTALLEGSLQLAARLSAEGGGIPPPRGRWAAVRRADAPVEVTAGLLRSKGFALVRFCFTLHGSHLPASLPRITPLYRERGWHRVPQDFFVACIIMLMAKPNICFTGL